MPCQHWGLYLHGEVNSYSLPVVGSSIAAQLTFAVCASIHFYMFYSGPSYFFSFIFLFFKLTEVKRQLLLLSALDICKARGLSQILC